MKQKFTSNCPIIFHNLPRCRNAEAENWLFGTFLRTEGVVYVKNFYETFSSDLRIELKMIFQARQASLAGKMFDNVRFNIHVNSIPNIYNLYDI